MSCNWLVRLLANRDPLLTFSAFPCTLVDRQVASLDTLC
jgi:hypothetical protein